ncbi:hypothetical protein SKAU_G00022680 [Synaphobranchus kaupii]|uniref:Uncharacterized protein n=1 Tax=Synaphobranchus kaupii TaxID=118154 RepID=A0A9Q1GDF7_SYNKA|nr:hypothetical protein SKAU_G00022680 [Synaphobranchus kaupii]
MRMANGQPHLRHPTQIHPVVIFRTQCLIWDWQNLLRYLLLREQRHHLPPWILMYLDQLLLWKVCSHILSQGSSYSLTFWVWSGVCSSYRLR